MARILVVDDEVSIRDLIEDVLAMEGHSVDKAANGLEAVAAAHKKSYDLMVIDRNMPKCDGIMALKNIRADAKLKHLKVLMCTSASITKEVEEAFAAGANDYILKPLSIQALVAKVNKLLAQP